MKKYRVGGHKGVTIFFSIWLLFLVGLMTSILVNFGMDELSLFFSLFCFTLMFGFVLIFIIMNIIGLRRASFALNGKKTRGKIVNFYIRSRGRGYVTYVLNVEYKTENGEMAIMETTVEPKNAKFFKIDKTIPIYVNDKYAYYKIEEVMHDEYQE